MKKKLKESCIEICNKEFLLIFVPIASYVETVGLSQEKKIDACCGNYYE